MIKSLKSVFALTVLFVPASQTLAGTNDDVLKLPFEAVPKYWVIKSAEAPRYPTQAVSRRLNGCASVAFIIEADGSTSHVRVLVSYPSHVFARPSLKSASRMRFTPTDANAQKTAVYTFNTYTYELGNPGPSEHSKRTTPPDTNQEIGENCKKAANKVFNPEIPTTASRSRR